MHAKLVDFSFANEKSLILIEINFSFKNHLVNSNLI